MSNVIGKYKTKAKISMVLGISAFTLPEGSTVSVTQEDKQYQKVLLCVDKSMDWVSNSILNKLEKVS